MRDTDHTLEEVGQQRHARAHSTNRSQGHTQAEAPEPKPPAAQFSRQL